MSYYRSYWSKCWPFSSDNFIGFDKLYKLQSFLNLLLPSFRDYYTPTQLGINTIRAFTSLHKMVEESFFHLLDVALVNSHILYKEAYSSNITQLDSCLAVAKSLLEGLTRPSHRRHQSAPELPLRLTKRAFPEPVPGGKRPDCKVCSNRRVGQRHQTGYRCRLCHTPLCLYPCFERYHTLKDYKMKYRERGRDNERGCCSLICIKFLD